MKKQTLVNIARVMGIGAVASFALFALVSAASPQNGNLKLGVVNFKSCLEGSKLGKQEQGRFEQMKKQLETTIDAKEKELNELAPKFSEEYLDTLSPEAEAELKNKFKALSQELSQQQNQYYSMLNQANYQIVHKMGDSIGQAAKKVAQAKGLDMAINEDICFYHAPTFDISKEVIAEMDAQFEKDSQKPADKK